MFHDLQRMKFGIRSEKIDPTIYYQDLFFNEAELGLHDESTLFESHSDDTEVKAHKRKKVGRRPLPDHLERIPDFHDISEEEKTCSCGHRLTEISPEISEQIVIKPPEVYVRQHQRRKYVCNHCKGDERNEAGKIVITAPYKTPQILPGSNLTVETLSFLLIFKWLDAIPLYRLSQMLLRNKIEIPRSTMSNWVIGVYLRYRELFSFFRKLLMTGRLIGIDETTYQVHREEGRKNTSVSYLWAFRGGFPNKPIIYYQYRISRSAEFLKEFLEGYNGIIQTDALATYNAHLKENPHILLAGCFAHVRRKFENTFRKSKEKSAEKILYTIKKIYEVEEKIRNRDNYRNREFDKIVEKRQSESKPLMDHLYNLISEEFKNPKKSDGLKVAINYALKEWKKIILYLDHGEIYIDNNLVENAIRPFVLGRKNWLFADVPEGAEASAMYLSIIQTFKANGLNPQTACEEFFQNCRPVILQMKRKIFLHLSLDGVKLSVTCKLHSIAGKEEALEWGVFRKGKVYISGTDYEPPEYTQLESIFQTMISESEKFEDIYNWAIHIFLQMSRTQFFYDVNSRMGRFLMNGILLEKGYPIINLPAKRQLDFNTKMIRFYDTGEEEEMNAFLRDCLSERIIEIMME